VIKIKNYIAYGLILIGLVGFFYFNNQEKDVDCPIYHPVAEASTATTENLELHYVEIRGEVRFPDVYQIEEGEILKTLIAKAGGLTEHADISEINQAQKLEENTLIIIPRKDSSDFYEDTQNQRIYIDIRGAVVNPGVYQVEAGLRLFEAIEIAGGLSAEADIANINMSSYIYDGILIVIPEKEREEVKSAFIGGEVKEPGFYEINEDVSLADLIILAGGLTDSADTSILNLSLQINDGDIIIIEAKPLIQKIYVSIRGEVLHPDVYYVDEDITIIELINLAGGLTENAIYNEIDYDQVLVMGSIVVIPGYGNDDYVPIDNQSGLININTASLDELQSLPGIGEILGQRIIDYRIEYGEFSYIEEIMMVSGIKDSIYEQIKDYITVR
jgi:competence protein ComEA